MEWAYVAGYFDGEGHCSLHPTARGGFARGVAWWVRGGGWGSLPRRVKPRGDAAIRGSRPTPITTPKRLRKAGVLGVESQPKERSRPHSGCDPPALAREAGGGGG